MEDQETLDLSYTQRQFIYTQLHHALNTYKVLGNKRLPEIFGPSTQSILRESLHTTCFYFPLKKIIEKKPNGTNSEKKKILKELYVFQETLEVPVNGRKISLEVKIDKKVLEKK